MSGKKRVAVSLSEENVAWIDENYNNRSAFIDDLVTRAREGESQMDDVVARYRLEQLNAEESSVESRLESIQSQKQRLREQLKSNEKETEALLSDAKQALSTTPKEPNNPAIQEWADDLGMTPAELIEELEGGNE